MEQNRTIPLKGIKLSEFDFSVSNMRAARASDSAYDAYVTVRRKGRKRKTDTWDFVITPFIRKQIERHRGNGTEAFATPKKVAIGFNRFKKSGQIVFAFDIQSLDHESVNVTYQTKTGTAIITSKGHVMRVLEALNIEAPTQPDTSLQIFLKLAEVEGQPRIYKAILYKAQYLDKEGISHEIKTDGSVSARAF